MNAILGPFSHPKIKYKLYRINRINVTNITKALNMRENIK